MLAALPESMLDLFRESTHDEQRELIRMIGSIREDGRRTGVCAQYLRKIGARLTSQDFEEYCADTIALVCERMARTADTGSDRDLYRMVWDSARNARTMATSRQQHRIRWGLLEPDTDIPDNWFNGNEEDSLFSILELLPENVKDTALHLAVYQSAGRKLDGELPSIADDVADDLDLSPRTVQRHVAVMRRILDGRQGECYFWRAVRSAYQSLISDDWTPYTTAPDTKFKQPKQPKQPKQQPKQQPKPVTIGNDPPIRQARWFDQMEVDVKIGSNGRLKADDCRYPLPYSIDQAIRDAYAILIDSPCQTREAIPEDLVFRAKTENQDRSVCRQPRRNGLGNRATLYGAVRTARNVASFCR